MHLKEITIEGFKSFAKKTTLTFPTQITGIVGPNGSGKSNVTEAFRFVLGEQSMKSLRGKKGEDLIFNGGSGSLKASKASISIKFDNKKRILHDSFDDVIIERTVHKDGTNEYFINKSQVRHRDIVEMLAKANIGSTGHHIISQGEADRILNSTSEEKKEMIEDGLGLKLLQYRKNETEKKIKKANENLKETDMVIRELTPQIKYLKKQVEKYEKAKELRVLLEELYSDYLSREINYFQYIDEKTDILSKELNEKINILNKKINSEKENFTIKAIAEKFTEKTNILREQISETKTKKESLTRELGRTEGEISALESLSIVYEKTSIESIEIERLLSSIEKDYKNSDPIKHKSLIEYIIKKLKNILDNNSDKLEEKKPERKKMLITQKISLEKQINNLENNEKILNEKQKEIMKEQQGSMKEFQLSEHNLLNLVNEKNILEQELAEIRHKKNIIDEDKNELKREIEEGTVLIGKAIERYLQVTPPANSLQESRNEQKERRRMLEKRKIELESISTDSGEETYKEFEEISNRIEFLSKEREDVMKSINDCESLIENLQKEIDLRFNSGIQLISKEFENFFKILFGGGQANISIEKNKIQKDEESEPKIFIGVVINLSIPHKKINSLDQLSGGERALTSIALLFAISQITPPPFLILDETDAALDEANSKRYADMIENLSNKSQLIVITHNRETMYRADTLYGVTMNTIGVSALLSIKFNEAVKVAK